MFCDKRNKSLWLSHSALRTLFILAGSVLTIAQFQRNSSFLCAQTTPLRSSSSQVRVVGEFLSVKHVRSAGDTFGYSLQLWRYGDKLVGLFQNYVGPDGDPPTEMIEDVKFNPRTRALSFRAELTTGISFGPDRKGVPSKQLFEF